jgi:hypothetical protein
LVALRALSLIAAGAEAVAARAVQRRVVLVPRIWRQLDPSAPNAALEHPVLRLLQNPPARRLVAALCDAGAAD